MAHASVVAAMALQLALFCLRAHAQSFDMRASPRLIRSGYLGIHQCFLPNCTNTSVLVPGYQGQAPYSNTVVVDQRRRQIYWIYLDLTSAPRPFIGAADADTGKPIVPGASDWVWIPRPSQDYCLTMDSARGIIYVLDHSYTVQQLDPDTKAMKPLFVVPQGPATAVYSASFLYHREAFYYGGTVCSGSNCSCLLTIPLPHGASDTRSSVSTAQPQRLVCSATDPQFPSQPAVLALSSSFLLVADPNLLTAFAYSYTGAFIQSHDLSRATPDIFVYGMRIDESVGPPMVYVCGSYRSQTYTVTISSVDLDNDSGSLLSSSQMDTCMGIGFIDTDESNAPRVTRIDPTTGPRAGGSDIVVAGSGFLNTTQLVCRFGGSGGIVVAATFRLPEVVMCSTPPSPLGGKAAFQVSNDGSAFSDADSASFLYV